MPENSTKYIDEREVSSITGRALPTLRKDRHYGVGIKYVKFSRSVRYELQDVLDFMEAHKIQTDNKR